MHVTLLALGSRGDVQPFVALGRELEQRGVRVTLAGLADYAAFVADYGLRYIPVVGAARELMDRELVYQALDAAGGGLPLGFARRFVAQVGPLITRLCAECLAACAGADCIVASTLGMYPGRIAAEALGVPLVAAHFHPHGSTTGMPDLSFPEAPPWFPLRGAYNRATHVLAAQGLWQLLRGPLNDARAAAGLRPRSAPALWAEVSGMGLPALYGYSLTLAPRPPDWPPGRLVTGCWGLAGPRAWRPPAELQAFLAAGPPPVYVGFGSVLAGRDPAAVTSLLAEALRLAGVRGLIYRGAWDDLAAGPLPAHILAIDTTPHDWLFPRVEAVVTHGGAGTVAAALRAARPVVTVPFYGDQRFWGSRVAALGVGPAPIPRAALSADRLAKAIRQATGDLQIARRARALGALIAAEHGAAVAAEAVLARAQGYRSTARAIP